MFKSAVITIFALLSLVSCGEWGRDQHLDNDGFNNHQRCERDSFRWWDDFSQICRTRPNSQMTCQAQGGLWRVDGRTGCCSFTARNRFFCSTL